MVTLALIISSGLASASRLAGLAETDRNRPASEPAGRSGDRHGLLSIDPSLRRRAVTACADRLAHPVALDHALSCQRHRLKILRRFLARKPKSLARNNKTRRWCSAKWPCWGFDGPATEIPAPPKRSYSAWGNHG